MAQFREQKDDASARRKIVRTLTREANLPAPDPFVGKIIRSLSEAGLFRGACVLLEQNAYRCFAANLGVELPRVSWGSKQTGISLIFMQRLTSSLYGISCDQLTKASLPSLPRACGRATWFL